MIPPSIQRMPQVTFVVAITLAITAFAVLTPTDRAAAHANQIRSSPSPDAELTDSPERIIVWFSEPIEASLSQVRLLDHLGSQVDNGDSALSPTEPTAVIATLPPLENGTYTVVWRNLSTVDGHRVVGSFRFAVGESISSSPALNVVSQPVIQSGADPWLRWVFIVGALSLAGMLLFDLLVIRPMLRPDMHSQVVSSIALPLQQTMARLLLLSLVLMIFGMVALLVQQASASFEVSVLGVLGDPLSGVLDSDWGRQWSWRLIAILITGIMVTVSIRSVRASRLNPGPDSFKQEPLAITETISGGAALAGSLLVLGLISYSSHNAAVPAGFKVPAVISDFLHLVAASAWIGGLLLVAIAIPRLLGASRWNEQSIRELSSLLRRFSPVALVSAVTLIATGIFAGYMQVTIPAATNTPYGWTLVVKIALLVPLFALASINSYFVSRNLLKRGGFSFRRLVRAEALVALMVLVAVGWLGGLEPARQFAGRTGIGVPDSVEFSTTEERANIDFDLTPGRVGANRATVRLSDRDGTPITNASDVRARLKFLEDDLGEPLVSLSDRGDGRWEAEDFNITIAGVYQVEIRVVRPDAFDAITSFRFDAASTSVAGDAIRPTRTVAWSLFGLALGVIGLAALALSTPISIAIPAIHAPRSIFLPGLTVFVVGMGVLLNALVIKAGFPDDAFNPFPLTAESVETGSVAYAEACASCHGTTGLGDGPLAGRLSSTPADLSVHVPLHTDADLFRFVRDGIPGTEMPGQDGNLGSDEMWHLVNFLRTFEN